MSRHLHRRAGLLFAASLFLLLVLVGRAFQLQVIRGESLASQATSQQEDLIEVPGLRGSILDRNGQALAGSEAGASIFATPYQVTDPAGESEKLAKALDADPKQVLEALTAPGGFSYVARKVSLKRAQAVQRLKLKGIGQHPDTLRVRPQGDLASQVIGAVGAEDEEKLGLDAPEIRGLTGLEAAEETVLHGTNGQQRLVSDAKGRPLRLDTVRDSRDGASVQLTLDATIQAEAEQALDRMAALHDPVNASAIVMDTRNSQILAMANWPPADLDHLDRTTPESLRNIGTSYTYEPGSTFKPFTVAAALETGTVTPESTFTLPPSITLYDRTIEESHPRGTVNLSVGDILAQSSNVGAVTVGLELGGRRFSRWIDRFGFGRTTGIRFPSEERGIVHPYSDWSGSTMGNLPIGQGLSVTPIQMVQAYGALANGGILRSPKLIKSIGGRKIRGDSGKRIISPNVASEVRQMLEGVLAPGGTASEVEVPGYTLAGKTGTAQIATENGYSDTRYVASFVGLAPAKRPAIAVAVMVTEPRNGHSGGEVAAPVFGDIAAFALPYLGVPTG
ncbi:MAG: penicillin-binding protein 2 [Solirubrobacterales bacterium]|nr:penicillin-binding protein 2 [Solirubrobacterales bacterium]